MSKIVKGSHVNWAPEAMILSVPAPAYIQTDQSDKRLQEQNHILLERAEAEAEMILRNAREMAQRIMTEAAREADELKQQTFAELEELRQQAREEVLREAEAIREEARRNGCEEGREEGVAMALAEEEERIRLSREVLAQAYAQKERIISEAEPFLVELAVEIARKIIGDELASSPNTVAQYARRLLERSRVHGQITLCVNHRYYQAVEEHRPQLLAILDGQAELSIYPDHTVQDEGCVIRTPFGSIDARIDTQLAEVRQVLLDIARGKDADEDA